MSDYVEEDIQSEESRSYTSTDLNESNVSSLFAEQSTVPEGSTSRLDPIPELPGSLEPGPDSVSIVYMCIYACDVYALNMRATYNVYGMGGICNNGNVRLKLYVRQRECTPNTLGPKPWAGMTYRQGSNRTNYASI